MRNWLGARDSRSWDDAVLGICCTQYYLMIMAWSDTEGKLDFVFLGDGRVEHKKDRDRGNGGNHEEKLGLKEIWCVSRFTITDTADTSPHPVGHYTDLMTSEPKQASRAPDISYPLGPSLMFWSSSSISLFLALNSTIIAEQIVKSSLSISPCHDHELTPSTALHQVQHTPSATNTKCSIHRVQHTQSTAYT